MFIAKCGTRILSNVLGALTLKDALWNESDVGNIDFELQAETGD